MNEKVQELKAEIFDILANQDALKMKFNELEQNKQEKLKKLQGILQSENGQVVEEDEKDVSRL